MENQLKCSYENIGSSSYLTVAFPPEAQLIGYQLEMLVSNEISYLLPVSRRVVNGETVVYYNISSRMTLAQIMDRRKLKRKEFLCLAEAAVKACQEVSEYQMSADGLWMDPEYIYVDPSNCAPAFVYLPTSPAGRPGLRELLMNLIMQGKLEMSNDNLIQMLLETLNSNTFSAEQLEACLMQFKNTASGSAMKAANRPAGARYDNPAQNFGGQPGNQGQCRPGTQEWNVGQGHPGMQSQAGAQEWPGMQNQAGAPNWSGMQNQSGAQSWSGTQNQAGAQEWPGAQSQAGTQNWPGAQNQAGTQNWSGVQNQSVEGEEDDGSDSPSGRPSFKKPGKKPAGKPDKKVDKKADKKEKKAEKAAKSKAAKENPSGDAAEVDGFDAEQAKKKFLIPQAVVMIAMAALISFGAFTNANGGIVINNVLAAVIVIGMGEVILYREVYVNSRKDNGKAKKASGKSAASKTSAGKAAGKPVGKPAGKPSGKTADKPRPPMPGNQAQRPEAPVNNRNPLEAASMQSRERAFGAESAQNSAAGLTGSSERTYGAGSAQGAERTYGAGSAQGAERAYGAGAAQGVERTYGAGAAQGAGGSYSAAPSWNRGNGYGTVPGSMNMNYGAYNAASETELVGETELWEVGDGGMTAYLEYYENGIMTRIPLDKPSVLVGRLQSQVDFAVLSPKVGKVHAEFINQNGNFFVKDLSSKNGTYINGGSQRINSNIPHPLNDNDRITLADSEFTLRCSAR